MKKMLMVVMACYAFTARSQEGKTGNFVYLYSDSVIYANDVSLRPDFYDSWRLRVDRRKMPVGQVKFVSSEDGFFANTRKLNFTGSVAFSERIIEGKINLFREIDFDGDRYDWRYRHPVHSRATTDVRNFYNKGFGDLKKVNYDNLRGDMADHPVSMDLLKGYRQSIATRNVLYTLGGASLLGSFITLLGSSSTREFKSPNYLPVAILMGAGIGFGLGGWSMHLSSTRKLESAIDAYNR